MAIYGEFLAAQNIPALTVWKQHRYAWTPFIATPETGANPTLDISMLGNQFRSDALLISNASNTPKTIQLKIQNPPANAKTGDASLSWAISFLPGSRTRFFRSMILVAMRDVP